MELFGYWPLIVIITIFLVVEFFSYRAACRQARNKLRVWEGRAKSPRPSFSPRSEEQDRLIDYVVGSPSAEVLRRLTSTAPLLGVCLSAFAMIRMGSGAASEGGFFADPDVVLRMLAPVFYGVLLGAFLAIWNQLIYARLISRLIGLTADVLEATPDDVFPSHADAAEALSSELRHCVESLSVLSGDMSSHVQRVASLEEKLVDRVSSSIEQITIQCNKTAADLESLRLPRIEQIDVLTERLQTHTMSLANAAEAGAHQLTSQIRDAAAAAALANDSIKESGQATKQAAADLAQTIASSTAAIAECAAENRVEAERTSEELGRVIGEAAISISGGTESLAVELVAALEAVKSSSKKSQQSSKVIAIVVQKAAGDIQSCTEQIKEFSTQTKSTGKEIAKAMGVVSSSVSPSQNSSMWGGLFRSKAVASPPHGDEK